MYVGIERSLHDLRAQGLPALLDAKTKSLEVFIAERRADGERWARDPHLAAMTADLRAAPTHGHRRPLREQRRSRLARHSPPLLQARTRRGNAVDRTDASSRRRCPKAAA